MIMVYKVVRLVWLVVMVLGDGDVVPIRECEEAGEYVADRNSCTRYHMCRYKDNEPGVFTTDVAICPKDKAFDLVTSMCVDNKKGYHQDPDSCTSFYRCFQRRRSSEGYSRRRHDCSTYLRYHPDHGYCTHKNMVPDTMCNSSKLETRIIGVKEPLARPPIRKGTDKAPGAEEEGVGEEGEAHGSADGPVQVEGLAEGAADGAVEEGTAEDGAAEEEAAGGTGATEETTAEDAAAEEAVAVDAAAENAATEEAAAEEEAAAAEDGAEDEAAAEEAAADEAAAAEDGAAAAPAGEATETDVAAGSRVTVPRPLSNLSDIDRITQVIRGQLLNRKQQHATMVATAKV